MNILAWSRSLTDEKAKELGICRADSPLTVAEVSDAVCIHLAASAETKHFINSEFLSRMKDGAILSNAGHFDVEVNIRELEAMAAEKHELRKNIMGYRLPDGRELNVLAEGRLVNLASGDGHPAEIMDMSFALQALCLKYILENADTLENRVYDVPESIDRLVAERKLAAMGVAIDSLSKRQSAYLYGEEE